MEYAYSLVAQTHAKAEWVDYEDCAEFDLVCPNCKESVFKVHRTSPRDIYFFSHRRRDKAADEECELRVKAMAASGIWDGPDIARGQALRSVLSDFQMLAARAAECKDPGAFLRHVHRIENNADVRHLAEDAFRLWRPRRDAFLEAARRRIMWFEESADHSKLTKRFNTEAGAAILEHLLTNQGWPNFLFLYAAGVLLVTQVRAVRLPSEPERGLIYRLADALVEGRHGKAMRALKNLELRGALAQTGKVVDGVEEFHHMASGLMCYVVGRIPYVAALRRSTKLMKAQQSERTRPGISCEVGEPREPDSAIPTFASAC